MKLKGRAGAYTFYSSKGRQIARVSQNSTNYGESARRSLAQQTRRVKWSNLVNFWKLSSGVLSGSFETKRANETDYNAFMRKNLASATVALTKDMAARGCCVPTAFLISEGSIPQPTVTWGTGSDATTVKTSLVATVSEVGELDTVADLTEALLSQDNGLKEGFQISLILVGVADSANGPTGDFFTAEVTLDRNDTRNLAVIFKGITVAVDSTYHLVFQDCDGSIGAAVILSDSTSGKLRVSSASIVMTEETVVTKYSSDTAVAAAIESYGLDPERFLDSGDYHG